MYRCTKDGYPVKLHIYTILARPWRVSSRQRSSTIGSRLFGMHPWSCFLFYVDHCACKPCLWYNSRSCVAKDIFFLSLILLQCCCLFVDDYGWQHKKFGTLSLICILYSRDCIVHAFRSTLLAQYYFSVPGLTREKVIVFSHIIPTGAAAATRVDTRRCWCRHT